MISLFNQLKTKNQYKKYTKLVDKINQLEPEFEVLSDQELRGKTAHFIERLGNGETIDDIKVEAFATVREASKRVLGMRHFDVQLAGGLVLTEGNIAEMATGEGKTLVASLPSYVRALEGKGVHVITVNEYLARRDKENIGQIHEYLGLRVGLNLPMMQADQKQLAYEADITYGVGSEFGFDYLRDNMVKSLADRVQRPYHFAIIDEVDSVLVDEAKTPLIVAGKMPANEDFHRVASMLAKRFKKDADYDFDEETKATSLTDQGIAKVEEAFDVDNLYDLEHQMLYHYVIQAVRAHVMFERDVDYIVKDGKILLVDMFTGRVMEGRTMSDGLHQAIEAKEGLEITDENKTQSQITIQNYFRMYPVLCGMTGTAKTQEKEFREVYGMDVVQIPTNRPKARVDQQDKVFQTSKQKYTAVVKEVAARHAKGQPVLIGTSSILQSDKVAAYLKDAGLSYQLLNAKSVEQENDLISQAGQLNQITIATNMAGRGTDILLGEGVKDAGGLFVLGTEKHESRRVDNQLRGRSGRQGDPGESQFFISLEDDMFRRFAREELEKLRKKISPDGDGQIDQKNVYEFVERTQRIVEGAHFGQREYNLKLDDVINDQRKILFSLRDRVLEKRDLDGLLKEMTDNTIKGSIEKYCPEDAPEESWDVRKAQSQINKCLLNQPSWPRSVDHVRQLEEAVSPERERLFEAIDRSAEDRRFLEGIKGVIQMQIDQQFVRHIESMLRLKEGIGLRSYQQEDPMRIYQREGFELFEYHFREIEKRSVIACTAMIARHQEIQQQGVK
ncbi:accessory Sec system translocase SecA2 [Jeotgalibacillus sp. JSM ZJ347]|uniref:accessory Sec system translocase SecA2 n=1 Tax=Jeotgalibacillus sp. JSM ZJ347 TaxID=3342117 RepID=UPI0035A89BBA